MAQNISYAFGQGLSHAVGAPAFYGGATSKSASLPMLHLLL